jgi:hypothetical protein
MNSLESKYATYLEEQKLAGLIVDYWYERVKFRLADRTYYTPDFLVQHADDTLGVHECKGFWEEDARIKIKVAAEQNPAFRFIAVQALPKKAGGGWKTEEF